MRIAKVLVTGATGKIGRSLVPALLEAGYEVRATRYQTPLPWKQVEAARGSMADAKFIARAVRGVDAVIHLATCKEDPDQIFNVSMGGMFHLLEAARRSDRLRRFILAGADAALGIFYNKNPPGLNESSPLAAYPGVYAFSKVIEEVMAQQYHIQYGLPTTILRVSWVMERDDILAHMLTGPHNFGVPQWKELARSGAQTIACRKSGGAVACLCHKDGAPYWRHVVAVSDVVQAFLLALKKTGATGQTFNIAGRSPFRYDVLAEYISDRLNLPIQEFIDPAHHDFTISIMKAGGMLGYRPKLDVFGMVNEAIEYRRSGGRRAAIRYLG